MNNSSDETAYRMEKIFTHVTHDRRLVSEYTKNTKK